MSPQFEAKILSTADSHPNKGPQTLHQPWPLLSPRPQNMTALRAADMPRNGAIGRWVN